MGLHYLLHKNCFASIDIMPSFRYDIQRHKGLKWKKADEKLIKVNVDMFYPLYLLLYNY